jgi:hypothetical protein
VSAGSPGGGTTVRQPLTFHYTGHNFLVRRPTDPGSWGVGPDPWSCARGNIQKTGKLPRMDERRWRTGFSARSILLLLLLLPDMPEEISKGIWMNLNEWKVGRVSEIKKWCGNQDLKFYLPTKNTGCPSLTDEEQQQIIWSICPVDNWHVTGTCPQLWGMCPGRAQTTSAAVRHVSRAPGQPISETLVKLWPSPSEKVLFINDNTKYCDEWLHQNRSKIQIPGYV